MAAIDMHNNFQPVLEDSISALNMPTLLHNSETAPIYTITVSSHNEFKTTHAVHNLNDLTVQTMLTVIKTAADMLGAFNFIHHPHRLEILNCV